MIADINEMADLIQFAVKYTPNWSTQNPYENAARALIEAGYKREDDS